MTVADAAEALEIPVEAAKRALDKSRKDAEISDEEFEKLGELRESGGFHAQPSAPGRKVNVYISRIRKHSFTVPIYSDTDTDHLGNPVILDQPRVAFNAYKLAAADGGRVDTVIRKLTGRGIMLRIDEPFKTIEERAAFRKMIEEQVYTGLERVGGFAPRRGLEFLLAWFTQSEAAEVALMLNRSGAGTVIEHITSTKSYKYI